MAERPELNEVRISAEFRAFYYLKEELTAFCRERGIPSSGGKPEIADRIAHYLDTGEILTPKTLRRAKLSAAEITTDLLIESDFSFSEKKRAFFRERIGKGFSFNVAFQKWLKENAGKTYADAVEAYYRLREEAKTQKTQIGRQFEYNTYIRDFFADNKGKTLDDAIRCWKYKKSRQGHNRYERADLAALEHEE